MPLWVPRHRLSVAPPFGRPFRGAFCITLQEGRKPRHRRRPRGALCCASRCSNPDTQVRESSRSSLQCDYVTHPKHTSLIDVLGTPADLLRRVIASDRLRRSRFTQSLAIGSALLRYDICPSEIIIRHAFARGSFGISNNLYPAK